MHLLDKLLAPEAAELPVELPAELAAYRYRWLSIRYPNPSAPLDCRHYYQRGLDNQPADYRHPRLSNPQNVRAYEAGLLRQPYPFT